MHNTNLTLSVAQMKKLSQGKTIRVAANKMSGSHGVLLTEEQFKKYTKAKKAGKGFSIKMSNAQITGSGWFDTFKSIARVAAPLAGAALGHPNAGLAISSLLGGGLRAPGY